MAHVCYLHLAAVLFVSDLTQTRLVLFCEGIVIRLKHCQLQTTCMSVRGGRVFLQRHFLKGAAAGWQADDEGVSTPNMGDRTVWKSRFRPEHVKELPASTVTTDSLCCWATIKTHCGRDVTRWGAGCWWGHSAHFYHKGQSYRGDFISYSIMLPPPVLNEPVYLVCKWWILIHLISYLTFIMLYVMASLQSNAFCLKYHFEYFMRWLDACIALRKRPVSGLQEAGAAIRVDLLHRGLTWWFLWFFFFFTVHAAFDPSALLCLPFCWLSSYDSAGGGEGTSAGLWAAGQRLPAEPAAVCWDICTEQTRGMKRDRDFKAFLIMFNLRLFSSWTLQIIIWLIFSFLSALNVCWIYSYGMLPSGDRGSPAQLIRHSLQAHSFNISNCQTKPLLSILL